MEHEINVSCCLCPRSHKTHVDLPNDWRTKGTGSDIEDGFCPDHAQVADFAESQCPGCVGGWTDCDLWRGFAYSGRRDLTDNDFAVIRTGRCPRRVNGTFSFGGGMGVNEIDLSEQASIESGVALVNAIKDYWERYPED